ncbi:MAG: hypothetical protein CL596_08415 [Alteromonas sp.]|nr:hypothetical protein [Alteromonas sp.]MAY22281.1 hypothetical protein [Flavobacteriaceae bacterium]|tara:strand:- start:128 stop:961 length:834 start_codon:yes stop_codon:yes gene_type:complete
MILFSKLKIGIYFLLILFSCELGKPKLIKDLPDSLKELSAAEVIEGTNIVWSVEDSGHDPIVYGFDTKTGELLKTLEVKNAKNEDWEDLTSDKKGNLYVGDFGDSRGKKDDYIIYKLNDILNADQTIEAEKIVFTLPKKQKRLDFEAFFIYKDFFYLFSKEHGTVPMFKIPNKVGEHEAKLVKTFKLDAKGTLITSADINKDENEMVLLNHDQVWVLSNFTSEDFFSEEVRLIPLHHNTQKEGVCYLTDQTLLITDERSGGEGGNLYSLSLLEETKE